MTDSKSGQSTLDAETEITLGLLNAVEDNSSVTQRSVASELGIALGLANAYLKRCINKGFIKVTQAPANRYAYYLTPQGFAEKSRLTARYLSISFNFFREARRECSDMIETCHSNGWRNIAFCGNSDLVEIAMLCANDFPITLVGVIGSHHTAENNSANLQMFPDIDSAAPLDAVIITDLDTPQETFDRLVKKIPQERILAPKFANISREQPKLME